tara:strand:- start:2297 stop:2827 length:531 start_codon:yes stop_codon:yes gene_type:complete
MFDYIKKNVFARCKSEKIAAEVQPLVDRLVQNNAQGESYRRTISHWLNFANPVDTIYSGNRNRLFVEGPRRRVGQLRFPTGGIFTVDGYMAHLNPVETLFLERRIKRAIETALREFKQSYDLKSHPGQIQTISNNKHADHFINLWLERTTLRAMISEEQIGEPNHGINPREQELLR